jgi:ankyrin repeat protein
MRICNRCGHETKLRDPECKNCGKIDESLGILDAVISGDLSKVEQILLVRPHLISVQTNRHAWTLLHMAASGGNKKMTELLIAKGAAVNATNRDGKTPLHYAAGKGHLNVVETLLAHFADPEAKYNGKTAADLAREHSQFEVEAYLSKLAKPATD